MRIAAECREETNVSRVKVEEIGRKAIFINDERQTYLKTKMDGCVIKNAISADWVISRRQVGDVVIELKGRDVGHAVKQVQATALFLTQYDLREGNGIAGLIVCKQYPKFTTTVQRAQASFVKEFKGPLHVVSRNGEYYFERVLDFKGPELR